MVKNTDIMPVLESYDMIRINKFTFINTLFNQSTFVQSYSRFSLHDTKPWHTWIVPIYILVAECVVRVQVFLDMFIFSVKLKHLLGQNCNTFVVRLLSVDPELAWLVTAPLNIELMVLKKLDFPAPTCPTRRTFTWSTHVSSSGQYSSTSFLKLCKY